MTNVWCICLVSPTSRHHFPAFEFVYNEIKIIKICSCFNFLSLPPKTRPARSSEVFCVRNPRRFGFKLCSSWVGVECKLIITREERRETLETEITYPTEHVTLTNILVFLCYSNNLKYYDNLILILNWHGVSYCTARPQLNVKYVGVVRLCSDSWLHLMF